MGIEIRQGTLGDLELLMEWRMRVLHALTAFSPLEAVFFDARLADRSALALVALGLP